MNEQTLDEARQAAHARMEAYFARQWRLVWLRPLQFFIGFWVFILIVIVVYAVLLTEFPSIFL